MRELTRKDEQVLLAVHHLRNDASLLTICEQVCRYTGTRYSPGTVYAPLSRLDGDGYVESRMGRKEGSSSKKPIRFYRLTPKGEAALTELQRSYRLMWAGFPEPEPEKS